MCLSTAGLAQTDCDTDLAGDSRVIPPQVKAGPSTLPAEHAGVGRQDMVGKEHQRSPICSAQSQGQDRTTG